jgi:hypothetical protein
MTKCSIEVFKVENRNVWQWRCSEHGEGAFYHKYREKAQGEAEWHKVGVRKWDAI